MKVALNGQIKKLHGNKRTSLLIVARLLQLLQYAEFIESGTVHYSLWQCTLLIAQLFPSKEGVYI